MGKQRVFFLKNSEGGRDYAVTEDGDLLYVTTPLFMEKRDAPVENVGLIAFDPFKGAYYGFLPNGTKKEFSDAEPHDTTMPRGMSIIDWQSHLQKQDKIWKDYLEDFRVAVFLAREKYGADFPID